MNSKAALATVAIICLLSVSLKAEFNLDIFRDSGIVVTIDVFSGRPNPEFAIRDSGHIELVIERLSAYIGPSIDSTLVKSENDTNCHPPDPGLGFRGLYISNFYRNDSSCWAFFYIGSETVMFSQDAFRRKQYPCQYFWDRGNEIEKLLITLLAEEHPEDSILKYVPEDLWPPGIEAGIILNGGIFIQSTPNPFDSRTMITYGMEGNTGTMIKIYGINGRVVYERKVSGNGRMEWRPEGLPTGVYLLKAVMDGKSTARRIVKLK